MSKHRSAASTAEDRVGTLVDWLELNSRSLMYGAIGLLVVAGGVWFYRQSNARQSESAFTSLGEAQTAMAAGNMALAQSDLEKLIKRYGDTSAGAQAHVLLAQVHYEKGEFQPGIEELKSVTGSKDAYLAAAAINLQGAGYEQLGKYPAAAETYQKAAAKATSTIDRDVYMANAARALTTAGNTEGAKKIWTALAKDEASPASAEARVRLGELEAKAGPG